MRILNTDCISDDEAFDKINNALKAITSEASTLHWKLSNPFIEYGSKLEYRRELFGLMTSLLEITGGLEDS